MIIRSRLVAFVLVLTTLCVLALAPVESTSATGNETADRQDGSAQPHTYLVPHEEAGCTGWTIVEAADNNAGLLYGVAAVAPNDVWAVGSRTEYINGSWRYRTLVEHWDGTAWSVVPSPNGGTEIYNASWLAAVSAISTNDVWAIGRWADGPNSSSHYPLSLHWDGVAWSIVEMPPGMGGSDYETADITAISSDDVWVVGLREIQGPVRYVTWTVHWDGQSWTMIPSPSPGTLYNSLSSVSGSASNDVWAVGYASTDTNSRPLLLHWDGTSWQEAPYPSEAIDATPFAVKAFAQNDVWVVGNSRVTGAPMTMHYDGTAWSFALLPTQPGIPSATLFGLSGSAPNDLWAVGRRENGYIALVVTYHWDGVSWSIVYSPTPTGDYESGLNIFSVTTAGPGHAWLVGYQNGAVIEQFGDPTTSCRIEFEDVPPASTFYPYVRCLACRTILSGYPCGGTGEPCDPSQRPYFRPGNSITRGQLSKIISNAAQFASMPGPQYFQDVGADNPFNVWVQNLAMRDFISGYPCGGEGEPCIAPRNLPYFRPNATATRSQIAKIVSNSLRLDEAVGTRRFQDVDEENVFYPFVQRLANRGALGGYPCGNAGEPCVPPENRPYFRPGNNATRGQLSKIVNTLFYVRLDP